MSKTFRLGFSQFLPHSTSPDKLSYEMTSRRRRRTTTTRTNSLNIKDINKDDKQVSNDSKRTKNRENTQKPSDVKVTLTQLDPPSVELDTVTGHRISSRTASEHIPDDAFTDMVIVSESTPDICVPSQAELQELLKMRRDRMSGLGSRKSSMCHAQALLKGRRHTQE